MAPRVIDQSTTAPVSVAQDPFDLDISVIKSSGAVEPVLATDGGCGASCGNACASNVA